MKILGIVLMLSATAAACLGQTTPVKVSSDEQMIRTLRTASNKAIAAGDTARFSASLEPGFVVVTGNGSFLTCEAYVAAFARDFKDPHSVRFERIIDSLELSTSMPLAAEHGHWIGRVPGGPDLFRGTYLAMWRKSGSGADSGWKLRSELFVSLACSDAAACASYRRKYGAEPAK